jgi:hypothetical protein
MVIQMAGNDSDERRRAEQAYKNARDSGSSQKTQNQLFADYEAAQRKENRSNGTSHQARR